MEDYPELTAVDRARRRVCRSCEAIYTINEVLANQREYFKQPYDYVTGCQEYCLACWLGVGPLDFPEAYGEERLAEMGESASSAAARDVESTQSADAADPFAIEDELEDGDLLGRFKPFLDNGCHLVVMPIARVHLEWSPFTYRDLFTFYPPEIADLSSLNIIPNRESSTSLAETSSALSGLTDELLEQLPLVAFPCRLNWESFRRSGHRGHLELIAQLSESVDRLCLNLVRYRLCTLDLVDTLPGRAGQLASNPMMAGACIYNHSLGEARIIGGAALTHYITRGLGLALESIGTDEFPRPGEVGNIVEHALGLYAAVQEASGPTGQFMQATSLLEYLAFPDEFRPLKKVRAVIVRYAARNRAEHDRLTKRFQNELFGPQGYRTQIVHNGKRLEQLLPSSEERKELFDELDVYMRLMIDDMIEHSEMNWDEFAEHRKSIGFGKADEDD